MKLCDDKNSLVAKLDFAQRNVSKMTVQTADLVLHVLDGHTARRELKAKLDNSEDKVQHLEHEVGGLIEIIRLRYVYSSMSLYAYVPYSNI